MTIDEVKVGSVIVGSHYVFEVLSTTASIDPWDCIVCRRLVDGHKHWISVYMLDSNGLVYSVPVSIVESDFRLATRSEILKEAKTFLSQPVCTT